MFLCAGRKVGEGSISGQILDKVIDRHGFESLDFSFLEGLELVANEQHSNLLIL